MHQLPMLEDLYADTTLAVQQNALNKILNADPHPSWLMDHPIAKKEIMVNGQKQTVPIKYMPIGRTEWLLTRIFIKWRVVIKSVQLIANSITVTVTLEYQDPLTGEWDFQDGVGAAPINTVKGAGATEFDKIISSSVQTATPAAESYAVKDAAEKIGKVFGKDINRREDINYSLFQEQKFKDKATHLDEAMIAVINEKQTPEELVELYNDHPEYHHIKEFMQIINDRKDEIKKGGQ